MISQSSRLASLISRAVLFPLTLLAFVFALGQFWVFIHSGEPMDFLLSLALGIAVAGSLGFAVMQQRQLIALCLQRA